jgi:hypothetical protein
VIPKIVINHKITQIFTRERQERINFDNRTQMNADNQDFKYNFGTKPEVKRKAFDII